MKRISLPNNRCLEIERSVIMGILNITPDSFFKGSRVIDADEAIARGITLYESGASIIDIGGESSRPGADPVSSQEEIDRVLPVIEGLRAKSGNMVISIDTYHPQTALKAVEAGADIINDISGFRSEEMVKVASATKAAVIIMHMLGEPRTMQKSPSYDNVVKEVYDYLVGRADFLIEKGISRESIILDPGLGFGKRFRDNIDLLNNIDTFRASGYPLLIGHSRKSFIGRILDLKDPDDRLEGTLAVSSYCYMRKVEIIRVHDVKEHYSLFKTLSFFK